MGKEKNISNAQDINNYWNNHVHYFDASSDY